MTVVRWPGVRAAMRIVGNGRLVFARPGGGSADPELTVGSEICSHPACRLRLFSVMRLCPAKPSLVAGRPARTAILDAIRSELRIAGSGSRFKVFQLKTAASWAYFEGNEIVHIEGREWQETDLTVKTLLYEDDGCGQVRALWSLPNDSHLPLREFECWTAEQPARRRLPAMLFP